MQPVWTRLSRDEAHQVLDKLSAHKDAIVFSKDATEVAWRGLGFYGRFRLYRLINYATMPTFTMSYLSDGVQFLALDGTSNPIYTVNGADPIRLNEMNVISYLEFFFSNVQGVEGEIFLIKDPKRIPFAASLSLPQKETLRSSFQPLAAQFDGENGVYVVNATLYYGGGLIAATMTVTADGQIAFRAQNILMSGIYFPHSPYNQQWAES